MTLFILAVVVSVLFLFRQVIFSGLQFACAVLLVWMLGGCTTIHSEPGVTYDVYCHDLDTDEVVHDDTHEGYFRVGRGVYHTVNPENLITNARCIITPVSVTDGPDL